MKLKVRWKVNENGLIIHRKIHRPAQTEGNKTKTRQKKKGSPIPESAFGESVVHFLEALDYLGPVLALKIQVLEYDKEEILVRLLIPLLRHGEEQL